MLMSLSDIIIDTFAAESATLRADRGGRRRPSAGGAAHATRPHGVSRTTPRCASTPTRARVLAALPDGDALRTSLAGLRRLLKVAPVNTVAARRRSGGRSSSTSAAIRSTNKSQLTTTQREASTNVVPDTVRPSRCSCRRSCDLSVVSCYLLVAAAACASGPPPPIEERVTRVGRAGRTRGEGSDVPLDATTETSPLLPEQKATFTGLPYYPINAAYRVPASLTPDPAAGNRDHRAADVGTGDATACAASARSGSRSPGPISH